VDKKSLKELHLSPIEKVALRKVMKKIKGTDVEKLLKDEHLI
jgi:myosin-crossreactive antigen